MRVATWNLRHAHGRRAQPQRALLDAIAPDVAVLTEVSADSFAWGTSAVASPLCPPNRDGRIAWVAVVGSDVTPIDPQPQYETLATAARCVIDGQRVIVYGTVLPWRNAHHQQDLAVAGESARDMFLRVLAQQVEEISLLMSRYPDDLLIWAGDFNQSLLGRNYSGSIVGRSALGDALVKLGLTAYNAAAPHANPELRAIYLICGPPEHAPVGEPGFIKPVDDGIQLSDHAGYYVDLE